jgi:hypothetical protein
LFALAGFSLPDFYVGVLLLLAFSLHLADHTMVQAGLVVFAFLVVLVNLLTGLLSAAIDPRITLRRRRGDERSRRTPGQGRAAARIVASYIAGNTIASIGMLLVALLVLLAVAGPWMCRMIR